MKLTPTRILALAIIVGCLFLISRYVYQNSRLEGFQSPTGSNTSHTALAPRSRFIFAGYNPLYDLVATQALLQYLDTVSDQTSSNNTPPLKFRDIPRLYIYWLRNAPDMVHIFISTLRKPQPLINLVENPQEASVATQSAMQHQPELQSQHPGAQMVGSMSLQAERLGQLLAKRPPATINMSPTSQQREQMRAYFRFFLDNDMQPLADIRLTEPDAAYLDLDPILAAAPNPEDTAVIPAIHERDPARQTFTALFQRQDPLRVNVVTPRTLTKAKELASKAAMEDTLSTIKRQLFSNPNGPNITPDRVAIFRQKIQHSPNGGQQAIIYFRLADDEMEASQSQLLTQLEQLGIADAVATEDNPHYPDYVLPRVPVHDFQQVQVLIRSTERGWDAS